MCIRPRSLAIALCLGLICPNGSPAEPYRLHPQDRVLIRVLVWDFAQNSMTGWQALSGEYSIGPDGLLQLPLAGAINAGGRSLSQLRNDVADLIRRSAGLDRSPELSVELISSIPVYVLGAAQAPGAVAYRPGLTARQALSLAGGVYRAAQAADPFQGAQLEGALRLAEDRLIQLTDEQARIQAELAQLEGDEGPVAVPAANDVHARLRLADQQARQARIDSLDSLQALLRQQIDRMEQQMQLRQQQLETFRVDLSAVEQLKEKGLAANARVTALSSAISEQESRLLDLEAAILLARQQLNQAQRDRDALGNDARTDRLGRLAALETEIAAATIQLETARRLYATSVATTAAVTQAPVIPSVQYVITRPGDDTQPPEWIAAPDEPLEPGDTLDIRLILPEGATPQ